MLRNNFPRIITPSVDCLLWWCSEATLRALSFWLSFVVVVLRDKFPRIIIPSVDFLLGCSKTTFRVLSLHLIIICCGGAPKQLSAQYHFPLFYFCCGAPRQFTARLSSVKCFDVVLRINLPHDVLLVVARPFRCSTRWSASTSAPPCSSTFSCPSDSTSSEFTLYLLSVFFKEKQLIINGT